MDKYFYLIIKLNTIFWKLEISKSSSEKEINVKKLFSHNQSIVLKVS